MAICPECSREYDDSVKVCPEDGAILTVSTVKGDSFIGRIIDEKYKILERLGDGGMGSVYKAEHLLMSRTVALKILRRSLADDAENDEFVRRFQVEARTASKINHPNAVTIHDFGLEGDSPYLVMEFNEGRSLKDVLAETGPLAVPHVISIMSQVCEAIDEAHSHGIVHRDLKPDNIMISKKRDGSDFAMVLDFGIAKILSGGGKDTRLTKTGSVIGTPRYMSPEQVVSGEIDARSDIYSLGVILYEMLTGDVPFDADSAMQLMMKHINETPKPIREFKPELNISEEIEAVVAKALAKDPAERPQSVLEFRAELRRAAGVASGTFPGIEGSGTFAQSSFAKSASPRRAKSARFSWPLAVVLSLIVISALAGVFIFGRGHASKVSSANGEPRKTAGQETPPETPDAESVAGESQLDADLIEQGAEQMSSGNYMQAVSLLEEALKLYPENPIVYKKLATCYTNLGRDEEALKYYREAVAKDPTDAKTKVLCGITFKRLWQLDEARREFQEALELDPELEIAKVQLNELSLGERPISASSGLLIPDLISQLGSSNREKRLEAAKELELRGNSAVMPLIESLRGSSDPRVRYWSAEILGRLKAEESVDPLILALDDQSEMVCDVVIRALKNIGTPKANEAALSAEAKQRAIRAEAIKERHSYQQGQQQEQEQQEEQEKKKPEIESKIQGFFDNFWGKPKQ